jgi:hypothetical protein
MRPRPVRSTPYGFLWLVVREGARYPFILEVMTGLGSQNVDLEVEYGPHARVWVRVASLPT